MLDRRGFLILSATFAAGCSLTPRTAKASEQKERLIDAGAASDYEKDGVYTKFAEHGFFIIRRGTELLALSATCTHRKCKLEAEPDRSFYCKCHGSTFDPAGHVTKGPAKRDLPSFSISRDEKSHLLVKVSARS
jgi:cytochrome b6-f complex iron-sulfur subunit